MSSKTAEETCSVDLETPHSVETASSASGGGASSSYDDTDTEPPITSDAAPFIPESMAPESPIERKIRSRTILEEVEENLAQSMLVFLLADLRLMSATGRVLTKYETIAIASDPPTRSTATELAGMRGSLPKNPVSRNLVKNMEEGLSPAQMMSVLIIELKRTVEARRAEDERKRAEGMGYYVNKKPDSFKDEGFMYFETDKKSGNYKVQAKEEDMHSLLRAYADMIGEDLKGEVPHIARRNSMLYTGETLTGSVRSTSSVRSSTRPLQPQSSLLSAISEGEDESIDTENATIRQAIAKATTGAMQQAQTPLQRAEALRQSIMTGPLMVDQETRTNEQFGEVTDAFFRQGVEGVETGPKPGESERQSLTQEELLDYMEKAVESRVYGKLDFLADFFRDGTVSKLMVESTARVVWMNDWYPLKDLTYAIAVDKEKRRVLVVFRGAITKQDWARAVESRNFSRADNPIGEDYDGKTDTIDVSSGFYQYLFRVRKDTCTTKYDEITNMACEYGKERIGKKFHLVVTGHSLGGALSTVFSFYASADERFTRNGPVKCFNFGSPYVGGRKFLRAFHHQERRHLLMYARFFNHNDIVAHLPFNFRLTKHGGKFRPVGIGVRLPTVPYGIWGRIRGWHPNVFYVKDEGFWRSYWRAIRDNFILKFPIPPWRFAEMHTLNEMQNRLVYGSRIGAGNDFALLEKPIDELYDMIVGTHYCTQSNGEGAAAETQP